MRIASVVAASFATAILAACIFDQSTYQGGGRNDQGSRATIADAETDAAATEEEDDANVETPDPNGSDTGPG